MKLSFNIDEILKKNNYQEEKIFVNNIKFDCKINIYKTFKELSQMIQNNQINQYITSCIIPKYDSVDFNKHLCTENQEHISNDQFKLSKIQEYISNDQFKLENNKQQLPVQQTVGIILVGITPDVAKIIQQSTKDQQPTYDSLMGDQTYLLNETVYVSDYKLPFYLNPQENKINYILTSNISKFQKLLMKLLENRNKVQIFTTIELEQYVKNILYQIQ